MTPAQKRAAEKELERQTEALIAFVRSVRGASDVCALGSSEFSRLANAVNLARWILVFSGEAVWLPTNVQHILWWSGGKSWFVWIADHRRSPVRVRWDCASDSLVDADTELLVGRVLTNEGDSTVAVKQLNLFVFPGWIGNLEQENERGLQWLAELKARKQKVMTALTQAVVDPASSASLAGDRVAFSVLAPPGRNSGSLDLCDEADGYVVDVTVDLHANMVEVFGRRKVATAEDVANSLAYGDYVVELLDSKQAIQRAWATYYAPRRVQQVNAYTAFCHAAVDFFAPPAVLPHQPAPQRLITFNQSSLTLLSGPVSEFAALQRVIPLCFDDFIVDLVASLRRAVA